MINHSDRIFFNLQILFFQECNSFSVAEGSQENFLICILGERMQLTCFVMYSSTGYSRGSLPMGTETIIVFFNKPEKVNCYILIFCRILIFCCILISAVSVS